MKRVALAMLTLLVVMATASVSSAIPPVLRSSTNPMWAAFKFGPAVDLKDAPTQFKLVQTFGYHFQGTGSGPAIAIDLQEGFGDHWTTFMIVPRFVYDIPIVSGLGLYLSPSGGFGFALGSADCGDYDCDMAKGLTLQFAFEGKLSLADRALVFFRPFCIEITPWSWRDEWTTSVRYELLFGGGVTF